LAHHCWHSVGVADLSFLVFFINNIFIKYGYQVFINYEISQFFVKVNKPPTPNGVLPIVFKVFSTNRRFLRNVIELSKRELLEIHKKWYVIVDYFLHNFEKQIKKHNFVQVCYIQSKEVFALSEGFLKRL
jgi:hypothetical protein